MKINEILAAADEPISAVRAVMDALRAGNLDGWDWDGQRLDDHTSADGSWHTVGRMSLTAATEHVMAAAGLRDWRHEADGCCVPHPAYAALDTWRV